MMEKSVQELVAAFQKGSREAFAQLVAKYQNLVTSVAYCRTGDLQRSEDIAQQAFLVAWQKHDELENPERFSAWLRGITNNVARNEGRLKSNQQRRSTQAIDTVAEPELGQSVDAETIRCEQSELLWSTLQNIPATYREPMILYYREGQSVAAVSTQLDLSEDAVKQRLRRGRSMMKKEIEVLVQNMLFETRPQEAFCASVMTLLPTALGSKIAGIAATNVGVSAGSKAVATKVATGAATGIAAGTLGALIGLFGGVAGAWIGTRQGIKHATSQEEKDLHYWIFGASTLLSIGYTLALLVLVTALRSSPIFTIGMIVANAFFFLTLISMIIYFVCRQKRLHQLHGKPEIYNAPKPVEQQISPGMLQFNAMGSVVGAWTWIIVLMAVAKAWTLLTACLATFAIFLYWAWYMAPLKTNRLEQTKLASRLCFWSTTIEAGIILSGYVFSLYGSRTSYDKVPFWGLAVFVLVFGFAISRLILFMGKRQHEASIAQSKSNY